MLPDLSGQRLDRYQLLRLLGSGSFGQVYLAEDHRQSPPVQVALKLLTAFQLTPQEQFPFPDLPSGRAGWLWGGLSLNNS